jgi:hypothetical protein
MPTQDQSKEPITYFPNSSLTDQVVYNPETQEASFTFSSTNRETTVSNIDQQTMLEWLAAPSFGKWYVSHYQER